MTRPLAPETRLVLRSADPAMPAAEAGALATPALFWPHVLLLAERELAAGPLWRLLEARQVEKGVPAPIAEYLQRTAMVSDFRMWHLSRRLGETTRAFAARGVRVLLLKGAAVGATLDPTFRARPMLDLDLLVRPADVPAARDALIAAGWTSASNPTLDVLLRDHHHLPPFVDPQLPGVRVELHIALVPPGHPFALDEEALWREAIPAPAVFAGGWLPSPETLLLHTCVHFAWQHMLQFGMWRTFRAVFAVAATPGFSWDRFVTAARTARAATSAYWTLRLARSTSGAPVPLEVLAALAPPTPEWARRALARHFVAAVAPGEGESSPSVRLTYALWRAAIRPGWSGHGNVGREDSERRWERAAGATEVAGAPTRVMRHLSSYRRWWRFVAGTLLRRD